MVLEMKVTQLSLRDDVDRMVSRLRERANLSSREEILQVVSQMSKAASDLALVAAAAPSSLD